MKKDRQEPSAQATAAPEMVNRRTAMKRIAQGLAGAGLVVVAGMMGRPGVAYGAMEREKPYGDAAPKNQPYGDAAPKSQPYGDAAPKNQPYGDAAPKSK